MEINLLEMDISKYFNIKNDRLYCHCGCNKFILNEEVIAHYKRLSEFREWLRRPMVVTSGYRCEKNQITIYKELGLKPVMNSGHLFGIATDVIIPEDILKMSSKRMRKAYENMAEKWKQLCKRDGIKGYGFKIYHDKNFIHFDSKHRDIPWVKM